MSRSACQYGLCRSAPSAYALALHAFSWLTRRNLGGPLFLLGLRVVTYLGGRFGSTRFNIALGLALNVVEFSLKSSKIAAFTSEDSCIRPGINEGLIVQSTGTRQIATAGMWHPFSKERLAAPARKDEDQTPPVAPFWPILRRWVVFLSNSKGCWGRDRKW
jgi:hypothetical protein